MRRYPPASIGLLAFTLPFAGCAVNPVIIQQTGGSAALFHQFALYDAPSGSPMTFDDLTRRAADSDVILWGEEHSDVVCNGLEAQSLAAFSQQLRPITLAMEFFENDTQEALDAYLSHRINEEEFRKQARQKKAYLTAHRPLIEYCREFGIPVVAANAQMRVTRALRLSGKTFDEFRATTQPADRVLLPPSSELLEGPYRERFAKAMETHEQPTSQPTTQSATALGNATSAPTTQPSPAEQVLRSYRAQSLWDDTMARSVATQRDRHPERRVMLIVGSFHIEREGGTQVKLRRLRPADRVLIIVYHGKTDTPLKFDEADRDSGDVVIYGLKPPEK